MKKTIEKRVSLDCTQYRNYELLDAFVKQAWAESWTEEEIKTVVNQALEDKENFTEVFAMYSEFPKP